MVVCHRSICSVHPRRQGWFIPEGRHVHWHKFNHAALEEGLRWWCTGPWEDLGNRWLRHLSIFKEPVCLWVRGPCGFEGPMDYFSGERRLGSAENYIEACTKLYNLFDLAESFRDYKES